MRYDYRKWKIKPTGKTGDFAYAAVRQREYGSTTLTGPSPAYLERKIDQMEGA